MTIKNILKQLKRIWNLKENEDKLRGIVIERLLGKDKELPKEEWAGFIDASNIFIFIPKKEKLREIIENNFDVEVDKERTQTLIKVLKYIPKDFGEIKCLYNGDYLKIIFNLTKGYDEVKIKMKTDYPIWVETSDFIITLAPRIEDEKEREKYERNYDI